MGQYTFRIDNKDSLYKKLIKLPTAYYRLKKDNNGNGGIIGSHVGTVEIGDINDLKLQKQGDKIVLYEGNSALKLPNGEDFTIEQEAIICENRDDIIRKLESGPVKISFKDIGDSLFGIKLFISRSRETEEVLNFINFYDEDDPVLQKIKEKEGGLYFTIESRDDDCSRTVYISDKDGNHLPAYDNYQYQYKPNVAELEIIDSLVKAEQNFTLRKGKELSDDVYEANIVLNGKTIATLPKIGYYMFDDQLVMHNYVTGEKVVIPRDFHYLKVVKFNNSVYKLTFCNFLGNEFFEYKKYDPQYSNVLDEYKFISLSYMKKEYNPNLGELLSYRPSFFITEGAAEPDSPGNYQAAVFEVTSSGKGKKMAVLINEFGSFDKDGKFQYCDYHTKAECGVYDPSKINKKYTVTDENSEFHLTGNDEVKNDDIILHTIPELL